MKAIDVQEALKKVATKERAITSARFFKTGPGQYGAGDVFIGVTNPVARKIAHSFYDISFTELVALLNSKIHEERFVALEILIAKYDRANPAEQQKIVSFYLKHKARINNWDLVDTSAAAVLGRHLFAGDRAVLYKLVSSKSLWDRRIAVVATHYFIKRNDFKDIFAFAIVLLNDPEDLMHKAVGWMLREVGKKNEKALTDFLDTYNTQLPRTTLRYAIERLTDVQRRQYMKK